MSRAFNARRTGSDGGEIQATFDLLESAGPIAAKLREAWERGMADIFGFSIDAVGRVRVGAMGSGNARIVEAFSQVKSVDLIVEPGAGGEVIDLIEALNEDPGMKLRDRMLKLIEARRPDLGIPTCQKIKLSCHSGCLPADRPFRHQKPRFEINKPRP